MVINGEPMIENVQSTEDILPVFESPDNTISLVENLPRKNYSTFLFDLFTNDGKLLI